MPPQRVTSACRQSTAPAAAIRASRSSIVAVLAGRDVTGRRAVAEERRPSRSADETGSSNQRHVPPASVAPAERLPASIGAVRVDEELGVADRLRAARAAPGRAPARGRSSSSRARNPGRPTLRAARRAVVRVRREPAASVQRHRVTSGRRATRRAAPPSSRAFRSHSATSTADMAIAPIPGRPALRSCPRPPPPRRRPRGRLPPGAARASRRPERPRPSGRRCSPSRSRRPAETSTTTTVVEAHSSVPSDSGSSVGIV